MTNSQSFQSLKSSPRHNSTQHSDMRRLAGGFRFLIRLVISIPFGLKTRGFPRCLARRHGRAAFPALAL
jgi:hypothetical protein